MNPIAEFTYDYRFLSNFWPSDFVSPTVEHRFQAAKVTDTIWSVKIMEAKTPGEAKRLGKDAARCGQVRQNWDQVKESVMLDLIRQKFKQADLRAKLLATGDAMLVEGNNWHDTYWGVCHCVNHQGEGLNKLGRILMQVREESRPSTVIV